MKSRSARTFLAAVVCTAVFLLVPSILAKAHAQPRRYAIIVGANKGDASEKRLRYAEDDARRIHEILRDLGGFLAEDTVVLTDTDASEIRRVLIRMNARLRRDPGDSLLFFYYSGHGDRESLHLSGSRLPMGELRDLFNGSPATARVMVLDACRSGALTRVKGGRPGPSFEIAFDERLGAEGMAILTSSAAGEDSQESDALKASFFTHYFASALLGAGDRNSDGRVTLAEAFQYSSERTLAATTTTRAGPQHPTYRYGLGGREDLLLTMAKPGGSFGSLEFPERGTYVVQQGSASGRTVAEVQIESKERRIALRPGRYFVTKREPSQIHQGAFTVAAKAPTRVRRHLMQKIDYARVVRKGATRVRSVSSVFAQLGARRQILELGLGTGISAGLRLDRPSFSLELRGAFDQSRQRSRTLETHSEYLSGSVALMRAMDWSNVSASIGLEAGATWIHQSYEDSPQTPSRNAVAFFLGPHLDAQLDLAGPYYVRAQLGLMTYLARATDDGSASSWQTPLAWTTGIGAGRYF